MELRSVLLAIGRNKIIVLVTVIAALVAGGVISARTPPTYETETKVLLTPTVRDEAASDLLLQANTLLAAQAPTYAALAMTPAVLDPAIASSGVAVESTQLVEDVQATLEPETAIITLTVNADSAEGVARLANAISASLISQVETVSGVVGAVAITGQVVQAPEIPDAPATPNLILNLAVALSAGLVVAFVVVVLRESLRPQPGRI